MKYGGFDPRFIAKPSFMLNGRRPNLKRRIPNRNSRDYLLHRLKRPTVNLLSIIYSSFNKLVINISFSRITIIGCVMRPILAMFILSLCHQHHKLSIQPISPKLISVLMTYSTSPITNMDFTTTKFTTQCLRWNYWVYIKNYRFKLFKQMVFYSFLIK